MSKDWLKIVGYWIQFVPFFLLQLLDQSIINVGVETEIAVGATTVLVFIIQIMLKSYRNPFASAFNLLSIFMLIGEVFGLITSQNRLILFPLMGLAVLIVFIYRILHYPSGNVYPDPSLSPSQVRKASIWMLVVTLLSAYTGPLFFIIVPAAYYYLPVIVKNFKTS